MQNPKIKDIEARVADLESEIVRLRNSLTAKDAEIIAYIRDDQKYVYGKLQALLDAIVLVREYLWPVVHKIFPGAAVDNRLLQAIIASQKGPPATET